MTKRQQSAAMALLPKDRSKLSPASLLVLARAIIAILGMLGIKLPDILDFLKANNLPNPLETK